MLVRVIAFTKQLGFVTVDAFAVVDHSHGSSKFIGVNNVPSAYRDLSDSRAGWAT